MHKTTLHIDKFGLHDSPVRSIVATGPNVQLHLEFAHIAADHPSNPLGTAQCIEPCLLVFEGVSSQSVQVWSEEERTYRPHPEPACPIHGEIMEFEAVEKAEGLAIKLTGFHAAGWTEWRLECGAVTVTWTDFSGRAWYES